MQRRSSQCCLTRPRSLIVWSLNESTKKLLRRSLFFFLKIKLHYVPTAWRSLIPSWSFSWSCASYHDADHRHAHVNRRGESEAADLPGSLSWAPRAIHALFYGHVRVCLHDYSKKMRVERRSDRLALPFIRASATYSLRAARKSAPTIHLVQQKN